MQAGAMDCEHICTYREYEPSVICTHSDPGKASNSSMPRFKREPLHIYIGAVRVSDKVLSTGLGRGEESPRWRAQHTIVEHPLSAGIVKQLGAGHAAKADQAAFKTGVPGAHVLDVDRAAHAGRRAG